MRNRLPINSYLMILLSALGFGSYGVWSKLIGQEFEVFFQGWVKSVIILVFLIPIAVISKSFKKIEKTDIKWIMASVLLGIGTQVPLYYAFNNMDIGTVTLIFYAMYLITSYFVGAIFLDEKIEYIKYISLILAFIGLGLVFGVSLIKFSFLALLLALINGIASGGEVSFTKKLTNKYSTLQISIYGWLAIFLTHLPVSILIGERQIPFNLFSGTWLAMISFAVASLIASWLVIEGYKKVEASIGSLIGLTEIIFGVFFGIIFFSEKLTVSMTIGGLVIIFAAMLPDLANLIYQRKIKT